DFILAGIPVEPGGEGLAPHERPGEAGSAVRLPAYRRDDRYLRTLARYLATRLAARRPAIPFTPPPGWMPALPRYSPATGKVLPPSPWAGRMVLERMVVVSICTTQPFTVFKRAVKSGAASIRRPMIWSLSPSTYSEA